MGQDDKPPRLDRNKSYGVVRVSQDGRNALCPFYGRQNQGCQGYRARVQQISVPRAGLDSISRWAPIERARYCITRRPMPELVVARGTYPRPLALNRRRKRAGWMSKSLSIRLQVPWVNAL